MPSPFFQNLQPASWRNLPFGVTSSTMIFGRKLATHEYPYVDGVYIEDLGAKGKSFHIMGFIVEGGGAYGGKGTLKEQIEAFEKAADQWGDGRFVHPTLGERSKMSLLTFEIEQDEKGRTATIRFILYENLIKPTLMITANTQAQTEVLSIAAKKASILDTLILIKGTVRNVKSGILTVVNRFTTQIREVIFTATSLFSMITSLPGEIGRYIGSAVQSVKKIEKSVDQLIGLGSASRVNVLNKVQDLETALADMNIEKIVNGISDTITAVYEANPDPVQAMNAMLPLVNSSPIPEVSDEAKGFNQLNSLIRRISVICIAQSTANREYISYDDAFTTRTKVCQLIDEELRTAGDQGLDNTYDSLLNLRTTVSQDLILRGADLATVEQINAATSLPSLVWAQKLYQDSSREQELVKSANPVHPAFMPVKFKALSS